jgi:hypothetical protein
MRDDQQKLQATQREGRKDSAKDLERDGQLRAASRQGHPQRDQDDPADQRRTGDRKPKPDR